MRFFSSMRTLPIQWGPRLLKIIPRQIAFFVIPILFRLFSYTAPKKRTCVYNNLDRMYKYGLNKKFVSPQRQISNVFESFGRYCLEFWGPASWRKKLIDQTEIQGEGHLKKALDQGSGVILLSAHMGNWELGAWKLAHLGLPVSGLYWAHPDEKTNQLFFSKRKFENLDIISIQDNAIQRCTDVLRRGRLLMIVADIDYAGTGIPVDWWTEEGRISRAPIVFAKRTQAVIIPALCIREGKGHRIIIEEPLVSSKKDFENRLSSQIIELYRRWMMRYPHQRLVFNRFQDRAS